MTTAEIFIHLLWRGDLCHFYFLLYDLLLLKFLYMQVLIVERSVEVITRLEEILSEPGREWIIRKASSYEEATTVIRENIPDVILLDISLPANGSFSLMEDIKKAGFQTTTIILSIHDDQFLNTQSKALGAEFYFDKYRDFDKIPETLSLIASKRIYTVQ